MWSGNPNDPTLPTTYGKAYHDGNGSVRRGGSCTCQKPSEEESCKPCDDE